MSDNIQFGTLESDVFDGIHDGIPSNSKGGYHQSGVKPMPKRIQPLTQSQVDKSKPKFNQFKLHDGLGLYLLVTPQNSKLWRFDYYFNGVRKTISFGAYPEISLDMARELRAEARQLVSSGINPSVVRKEARAKEKMESSMARAQPSVRIAMDGEIEIWKGRHAIRLTSDEALFIKNQFCKLFP